MNVIRNKYISALGIPRTLAVFVLFSVVIGCNGEKDADVLPQDKLAQVYADMAFVKELYAGKPALYNRIMDSLLRANNTDTLQIKRSFEYYANDPEVLDGIYNESIRIVEERSKIDTVRISQPDSSGL